MDELEKCKERITKLEALVKKMFEQFYGTNIELIKEINATLNEETDSPVKEIPAKEKPIEENEKDSKALGKAVEDNFTDPIV